MPRLLHDRLIDFAVATGAAADSMPRTPSGTEIADQLARCGQAPAALYSEARNATTDKDYVYKMQLCVGELRESVTWMGIARRRGYQNADYPALENECKECIAIAVTCAKKARAKLPPPRRKGKIAKTKSTLNKQS